MDKIQSCRCFGGNNTSGEIDVATAVNARGGAGRMDFESETFVTHSLRADGFDASEDGTGRGTPIVPVICPTLRAGKNSTEGDRPPGTDVDTADSLIPIAFDTTQITSAQNRNNPKPGAPCHPLAAGAHAPAIAFQERGRSGGPNLEYQEGLAYSLNSPQGGGRHQELNVCVPILEAGARTGTSTTDPRAGIGIGQDGDPMFSLQAGKQHAIAFSCKDSGSDAADTAPTLRAMEFDGSHANGGGQIAIAFHARQDPDISGHVTQPLDTDGHSQAVAINLRGRDGGAMPECADVASLRSASGGSSRSYVQQMAANSFTISHNSNGFSWESDINPTIQASGNHPGKNQFSGIRQGMAVRRLTPTECERLMDVGDGYTAIPYNGKPAADGPRYRALGNSWAIPCVAWIAARIEAVERILAEEPR